MGKNVATWLSLARILRRLALMLIAACVVQMPSPAHAKPGQIWFAPFDQFIRPNVGYGGSRDYMDLFDSPAGDAVLSRIDVFKIYAQFVALATNPQLRAVFAALKRHHVALALEEGILTTTKKQECGHGVEGYWGQDDIKTARRIRQQGGDLVYFAMDEPASAFYGHLPSSLVCHADIKAVAQDAAKNITALRTVFPNLRVGDIEPVSYGAPMRRYSQWADAFRAATGQPLAFLFADVQWRKPYGRVLEQMAATVRQRGIPFGVIYNGESQAASNTDWTRQAKDHYRDVEGDPRISPDLVLFQSWVSHPDSIFPATEPGTFSHLLGTYFHRMGR